MGAPMAIFTKQLKITLLFLYLLTATSCSYFGREQIQNPRPAPVQKNAAPAEEQTEDPLTPVVVNPKTERTYSEVKKYVLDPSCIKCHSNTNPKGDVTLETYADVIKNLSDVRDDVVDGSMPKRSKLTDEQKTLILEWIKLGAPEFKSDAQNTIAQIPQIEPSVPANPPKNEVELQIIKRGEYLFNISSCSECHTQDPRKPLAGGKELVTPFGKFYAPNITPDPFTGIGLWTENEFLQAFRNGKSPSGKSYYPAFPYTNYSKMSDQDILSLRAYIFSLPGYDQQNKSHEIKFPFNKRVLINSWKILYFPKVKKQTEENFMTARGPFQGLSEKDILWNRGAYLVEGPLHCTACHTPRNELGGYKKSMWMGGAKGINHEEDAPNISSSKNHGLGLWSENDWLQFLNTGVCRDGDRVGGEMLRVIRGATSQMTDHDKAAVIDYLMSLPPVE